MATLSDVARLAGVSISAASRVLSDAPSTRVRPETRDRIKQAARELDYRPNFAGRALKFSRTNVIAMIVPDLTNAIFTELMRGVQDAAVEHDYMVLLGRTEDLKPGGESIRKLLGEGRVDGILVQPDDSAGLDDTTGLLGLTAPIVVINSIEHGNGNAGSVLLDDEAGARVATEHLIALGHRRIAHLGGSLTSSSAQRRLRGYRAAMENAGLETPAELITSFGYLPGDGRKALQRMMSLGQPPTAAFVANVNAAIGALAEARSVSVGVPEDLSIVAYHDAWTAENTWPPLTTVKMPLYELGRHAVEALAARLDGSAIRDLVISEPRPKLIIRDSTRKP
jgi:LacI family transcriptional regulator